VGEIELRESGEKGKGGGIGGTTSHNALGGGNLIFNITALKGSLPKFLLFFGKKRGDLSGWSWGGEKILLVNKRQVEKRGGRAVPMKIERRGGKGKGGISLLGGFF